MQTRKGNSNPKMEKIQEDKKPDRTKKRRKADPIPNPYDISEEEDEVEFLSLDDQPSSRATRLAGRNKDRQDEDSLDKRLIATGFDAGELQSMSKEEKQNTLTAMTASMLGTGEVADLYLKGESSEVMPPESYMPAIHSRKERLPSGDEKHIKKPVPVTDLTCSSQLDNSCTVVIEQPSKTNIKQYLNSEKTKKAKSEEELRKSAFGVKMSESIETLEKDITVDMEESNLEQEGSLDDDDDLIITSDNLAIKPSPQSNEKARSPKFTAKRGPPEISKTKEDFKHSQQCESSADKNQFPKKSSVDVPTKNQADKYKQSICGFTSLYDNHSKTHKVRSGHKISHIKSLKCPDEVDEPECKLPKLFETGNKSAINKENSPVPKNNSSMRKNPPRSFSTEEMLWRAKSKVVEYIAADDADGKCVEGPLARSSPAPHAAQTCPGSPDLFSPAAATADLEQPAQEEPLEDPNQEFYEEETQLMSQYTNPDDTVSPPAKRSHSSMECSPQHHHEPERCPSSPISFCEMFSSGEVYIPLRCKRRKYNQCLGDFPMFAPRGMAFSTYTKKIIQYFNKYKKILKAAQSALGPVMAWGPPLLPGNVESITVEPVTAEDADNEAIDDSNFHHVHQVTELPVLHTKQQSKKSLRLRKGQSLPSWTENAQTLSGMPAEQYLAEEEDTVPAGGCESKSRSKQHPDSDKDVNSRWPQQDGPKNKLDGIVDDLRFSDTDMPSLGVESLHGLFDANDLNNSTGGDISGSPTFSKIKKPVRNHSQNGQQEMVQEESCEHAGQRNGQNGARELCKCVEEADANPSSDSDSNIKPPRHRHTSSSRIKSFDESGESNRVKVDVFQSLSRDSEETDTEVSIKRIIKESKPGVRRTGIDLTEDLHVLPLEKVRHTRGINATNISPTTRKKSGLNDSDFEQFPIMKEEPIFDAIQNKSADRSFIHFNLDKTHKKYEHVDKSICTKAEDDMNRKVPSVRGRNSARSQNTKRKPLQETAESLQGNYDPYLPSGTHTATLRTVSEEEDESEEKSSSSYSAHRTNTEAQETPRLIKGSQLYEKYSEKKKRKALGSILRIAISDMQKEDKEKQQMQKERQQTSPHHCTQSMSINVESLGKEEEEKTGSSASEAPRVVKGLPYLEKYSDKKKKKALSGVLKTEMEDTEKQKMQREAEERAIEDLLEDKRINVEEEEQAETQIPTTAECPMCWKRFAMSVLEEHASTCQGESVPQTRSMATPDPGFPTSWRCILTSIMSAPARGRTLRLKRKIAGSNESPAKRAEAASHKKPKSVKDDTEPEDPLENLSVLRKPEEAIVGNACPLCHQRVSADEMNDHVNRCLDQAEEKTESGESEDPLVVLGAAEGRTLRRNARGRLVKNLPEET